MKRFLVLIMIAAASFSCRGQKKADPVQEMHGRIRLMAAAATAPEKNAEKEWAADSLNLNVLTSSGLWDEYFAEWIALYRRSTGSEFDTKITEAAKRLLLRSSEQSPDMVKPLVRTLCEQLAASKDLAPAAAVAAYPHGFDLPGNTYSEIAERLLGALLLPGQQAPAIEGAGPMPSPPPFATIVFFYETGCRTCGPIIEEMIGVYDILDSRHVRVITISSDMDPVKFADYAAAMPWPDKLCDLQGFAGDNFKRYRVASTPAMWVIDDKGIIVDRYGDIHETGLLL